MSHATANVSLSRMSQKGKSESLICDVCFAVCYSQSDLRRHKETHDGKTDFTCTFCGEVFQKESGMRRHQRHEHPDEILANSEDKIEETLIGNKEPVVLLERACENELLKKATGAVVSKEPLREEPPYQKVPTAARFRCKICSESLANTDEMMKHIEVHGNTEGDDVIDDVVKPEEVGNKRKIAEEILTPCKMLKLTEGETIGARSDLGVFEIPETENAGIAEVFQPQGDPSAVEEASLAAVVDECINKSISEENKEVQADETQDNNEGGIDNFGQDITSYGSQIAKTQKSSIKKKNLKDVLGTMTFRCTICHDIFTDQAELEQHVGSQHFTTLGELGDSDKGDADVPKRRTQLDTPIHCKDCDEIFLLKKDLKLHRRAVHKTAPVISSEAPVIIQDMVIKGEGRAVNVFRCNICPRSFNLKSDLMRHFLIHSGEKPFACDMCENRFNRKSNLVRHKKLMHHIEHTPSSRARRPPELEWGPVEAMRRKPRRKQLKKEEWEIEDEQFAEEERRLLQKLIAERQWEREEDETFQDSDDYYEEIEDEEFVDVENETEKNEGDMEVMVIEPGDQITVRILTY